MIEIEKIIEAINKGSYDMEAWDFRDQEPADCQEWCRNWFNKQSLKYKLERVSFIPDDDTDYIDSIQWIIDFQDALNTYWEAVGYSIDSAYYAVILHEIKGE